MSNSENQLELSNKENNLQVNKNDTEEKTSSESITLRERLRRLRKFITIEPFLATYAFANVLNQVATQKFINERACVVDLNFPADICYKVVEGIVDNFTSTANHDTATAIGNYSTWKLPLERILPLIFTLNIGAWSDRTGNRKAVIMVPLIGLFLSTIAFLLGMFITTLPVWYILLADALISTFTGGFSTLFSGIYSYVTEATEPEERAIKISSISVVATVSGIVGQLIAGELTQATGTKVPLAISIAFSMFGILYTYYKIHDVNRKKQEGTTCEKIAKFLSPKGFWESFSLLVFSKGQQLVQILLILAGYIFVMGPLNGAFSTYYYYLLERYAMNEVEFTWLDSSAQVLLVIGTAIGGKFFLDMWKINDCVVAFFSALFKTVGYALYAFAPNRTWLYATNVVDMFGNLTMIVLRTRSTTVVDSGDIGKMTSLITVTDAIIGFVATPIYNQVWVNYKAVLPGVTFLLASISTVPNLFVVLFLYLSDKKQQRDVVVDPKSKEKHVYDNEITPL